MIINLKNTKLWHQVQKYLEEWEVQKDAQQRLAIEHPLLVLTHREHHFNDKG